MCYGFSTSTSRFYVRNPLLSIVMLTMRSRSRLRAVTIPRLLNQMMASVRSTDLELVLALDADDDRIGMRVAMAVADSHVERNILRGRWSTVTEKQNAAIAAARGKFVTLWDDDDYVDDSRIDRTLWCLESAHAIIGQSSIHYHELNSPDRRTVRFTTPAHVVDGLVTFRRDIWEKQPFTTPAGPGHRGGNVGDWIVRRVAGGAKLYVQPEYPYVAMIHGDNATTPRPFRIDPVTNAILDGPREYTLMGGREIAAGVMGENVLSAFEEAVR